jgi:hypothetical protein
MRHYSLVLVHALDNPPFPNAKYKCDIINWGYMMRIIDTINNRLQLKFFTITVNRSNK